MSARPARTAGRGWRQFAPVRSRSPVRSSPSSIEALSGRRLSRPVSGWSSLGAPLRSPRRTIDARQHPYPTTSGAVEGAAVTLSGHSRRGRMLMGTAVIPFARRCASISSGVSKSRPSQLHPYRPVLPQSIGSWSRLNFTGASQSNVTSFLRRGRRSFRQCRVALVAEKVRGGLEDVPIPPGLVIPLALRFAAPRAVRQLPNRAKEPRLSNRPILGALALRQDRVLEIHFDPPSGAAAIIAR